MSKLTTNIVPIQLKIMGCHNKKNTSIGEINNGKKSMQKNE